MFGVFSQIYNLNSIKLHSNAPRDHTIVIPQGIRLCHPNKSAVAEHCISLNHRILPINTILLEKKCWRRKRITGWRERSSFTLMSCRESAHSPRAGRRRFCSLHEGTDAKIFLSKEEES